ncbi:hypothetical protein [Curtobacterium pusillum]|uniref:hypothetical protein n=1 Tax=Curtobacterium pusillum TaxID=69373 RepID=UPI0011A6EBEA|nr:hypothetical protein [Curtobacterium pusillum]
MDENLWVLKDSELDLVRGLEPDRIRNLDEDALLRLHRRVRRARNKHVSNYRRKAAQDVGEAGARGAAYPKGAKSRLRAEIFEDALAVVSERLAVLAHRHAEELKAARLEQARVGKNAGPHVGELAGNGGVGPGIARTHAKTTGGVKRDASERARGSQQQAKKDSRNAGS